MQDDSSDILAGPTLPNLHDNTPRWFSTYSVLLAIPVILFLFVVAAQIWERFLLWREKSYKLAMRRRHGIPDSDHRPFNVAYAAVVRARQEREAAARRAKLERVLIQDNDIASINQNARLRPGFQRNDTRPVSVPGRFDFPADDIFVRSSSLASLHHTQDRYNPRPAPPTSDDFDASKAGPSRRGSRKVSGGRAVDKHDGHRSSRVGITVREVIGSEEQQPRVQRGSKRVLVDDDDIHDSNRLREKRLRKVSLEKTPPQVDTNMDVDDAEDVSRGFETSVHGKKRDRDEAGSTFGGDEDSALESDTQEFKSRRHRKRRTYVKRKSDVAVSSRGQKRDRNLEDDERSVESDDGQLNFSRKRGKRLTHSPGFSEEDISMDDLAIPGKGKHRRVGEEWESNGITFKVGPDGQRLRQTLVKKEQHKFPMPMDSQHPDRQANLEICVEVWLTEEEYREAKDQMRLAWQDSSKHAPDSGTPTQDSSPVPQTSGKDLLWQSTTIPTTGTSTPTRITPPPSPPHKAGRDLQRQSVASSLRINAFPASQTSKRIAPTARVSSPWNLSTTHSGIPASPILADSVSGSSRGRYLSKWEKQDMEAKAIMRMREVARKKEEEKAQQLKEEQEKAESERREKEAAAAAAAAPKLPTITLTKPPEDKPAETKAPTFAFSAPASDSSKLLSPSMGSQAQTSGAAGETKPANFGPNLPAFSPQTMTTSADIAKPTSKSSPFTFPLTPSSSSTAASPASSAPSFSINPAPSQPSQPAKPDGAQVAQSSASSSLFSRLSPSTSMGAQSTSAVQPTSSPFVFQKPDNETIPPASPFNTLQATPSAAPTSTNSSTSLKFNFSKASPAPAASSPFGSTNVSTKPTTTVSSFGFPKPTTSAPTGAVSNGTAATPKFSFMAPAAAAASPAGVFSKPSSTFGATAASVPTSAAAGQASPLFGSTISTTPASFPFSGTSSSTTSAGGNTGNITFGGTSMTSSEPPTSTVFAPPPQITNPTVPTPELPKPASAFGGSGPTMNTTQKSSAFGSSASPFGGSSSGTMVPNPGQTENQRFTFPMTSSSSVQTPSSGPAMTAGSKPTAPPFSFNFGAPSPAAAVPNQTSTSLFGLGASTMGSFTFGKPPTVTNEKQQ